MNAGWIENVRRTTRECSIDNLNADLAAAIRAHTEKYEMHKLVQDTGLNISGLRTDAVNLGSVFIGLGPEPAAQKFRDILKDAIAET